jgi:rubrerythrin
MVLTKEDRDMAFAFCVDEYTDHLIYSHLAAREKRNDFKELLEKMAEHEYRHYEFWKAVAGRDCNSAVPK